MKTLILLIFFSQSALSQTLIPESIKVKRAFEKLSLDKENTNLQAEYVKAFPNDTKTFLKVFNPANFDQLYKGSDKYLNALENCTNNFADKVLDKCINIGKNLAWDADAVGYLQTISVALSTQYLSLFVDKFKALSVTDQTSLIKFYADVENHKIYSFYQKLINKLTSIGQTDIAKKLEVARRERQKVQNH